MADESNWEDTSISADEAVQESPFEESLAATVATTVAGADVVSASSDWERSDVFTDPAAQEFLSEKDLARRPASTVAAIVAASSTPTFEGVYISAEEAVREFLFEKDLPRAATPERAAVVSSLRNLPQTRPRDQTLDLRQPWTRERSDLEIICLRPSEATVFLREAEIHRGPLISVARGKWRITRAVQTGFAVGVCATILVLSFSDTWLVDSAEKPDAGATAHGSDAATSTAAASSAHVASDGLVEPAGDVPGSLTSADHLPISSLVLVGSARAGGDNDICFQRECDPGATKHKQVLGKGSGPVSAAIGSTDGGPIAAAAATSVTGAVSTSGPLESRLQPLVIEGGDTAPGDRPGSAPPPVTDLPSLLPTRTAETVAFTAALPAAFAAAERRPGVEPSRGVDEGSARALSPNPSALVEGAIASIDAAPVRALLVGYRTAYERLDASLAKQIWPRVDERALARAFKSLESQTVTFDTCDVSLASDRAVASCRGSATYVTRMGHRSSHTERRQWTFQLERSPDRWVIDSVRIQ